MSLQQAHQPGMLLVEVVLLGNLNFHQDQGTFGLSLDSDMHRSCRAYPE